MEDYMSETEDDPLQESLDALAELLGDGDNRRRQHTRDSRSVPHGDRHQAGVYFVDETRQVHDAMQEDACEVARQRNLAERHALNDYAAEQSEFWDRKLAEERRDRR
jgi:hypothetical protein